mmetsp:Transcript_45030/g.97802  ORF Transcript_45030/g.97802 Transcript_45030/m.97802 type:complete len:223 (+) Transcript_45030:41-709(+)
MAPPRPLRPLRRNPASAALGRRSTPLRLCLCTPLLAVLGFFLGSQKFPAWIASGGVPPLRRALLPGLVLGVYPTCASAGQRSVEEVAKSLDKALREDIWFVSGRVRKEFFSLAFKFRDPDVSLAGIEAYGKGVAALFDQEKTRAEILDVRATGPSEIEVRWRLEATVGLPPTLPVRIATAELKPYVVTSILRLDQDGLVEFQEDVFDQPTSELLKSARITFR